MKRSGPPKRSKGLTRHTPISREGKKRKAPAQPAIESVGDEVRSAVLHRSRGLCEACGAALRGTPDLHHRKLRSRGGDNSAENLIAVHRTCHEWIHRHPKIATLAYGLMVSSWAQPWATPMVLWGIGSDGVRATVRLEGGRYVDAG